MSMGETISKENCHFQTFSVSGVQDRAGDDAVGACFLYCFFHSCWDEWCGFIEQGMFRNQRILEI
jgi:hypothetical protein